MIYQVGNPVSKKMMMMMLIYQVRSVKVDDLPGRESSIQEDDDDDDDPPGTIREGR